MNCFARGSALGATDGTGVSVKTKSVEATVSQGSVDRAGDVWLETLAWAERNPNLWFALLALAAFWLFLNYLRSRDSKRMQLEYKERRDAARVEPEQLVLPHMNHGKEIADE